MILDNLNRLVAAQAFTSTGAVSTNSLPLKVTGRDIFNGEPMAMVFTITTAALTTGTCTYTFRAQTATDANGTSDAVIVAASPVYAFASGTLANRDDLLEAGTLVVVPLPPELIMEDATHLAGYVLMANGSPTVSCNIDVMPLSHVQQSTKKYADAAVFG